MTRTASTLLALSALLAGPGAPAAGAEASAREAGPRSEGPGYAFQLFTVRAEGGELVRHEARGTVDAPPEALLQAVRTVIADPARAPRGQTRRMLLDGEDEFIVYTRIELPPLFEDRDIVTRGVRAEEGSVLRIDWSAVEHPDAPPRRGVIRIERSEGSWTFEPRESGGTDVVYSSYVDIGGALPSWLVGRMTASTVARTFEQVAREAMAPTGQVSAEGRAVALP